MFAWKCKYCNSVYVCIFIRITRWRKHLLCRLLGCQSAREETPLRKRSNKDNFRCFITIWSIWITKRGLNELTFVKSKLACAYSDSRRQHESQMLLFLGGVEHKCSHKMVILFKAHKMKGSCKGTRIYCKLIHLNYMQIILLYLKICTFTVLSCSNTKAERKMGNGSYFSLLTNMISMLSLIYLFAILVQMRPQKDFFCSFRSPLYKFTQLWWL